MKLATRHFGEININSESIIKFENGIPGFEKARNFIIIDSEDGESPFKWLQCIDIPELALAVINPFFVRKDYDLELSDETVKGLEIKDESDVRVYSIVVVPEDITKMTMNLKAPLIVNSQNRMGEQIILDTDKYSVRHYILDEIRKQEVAENAGTNKEKGSNHNNK